MSNRIWQFKSVQHQETGATAHLWQWRAIAPDGVVNDSRSLFGTLTECVRDAQRNGFRGEVDPSNGSFTPRGYQIDIREDGAVTFTPSR